MVGSLLAFIIFARIEARSKNPFLPFALFTDKTIVISALSLAITGIGMFGSTLLIPLFLQSIFGLSASQSGIVLGPLVINVAVCSVIGGYWMSTSGKYKTVVLTGLICMTMGCACLATINEQFSLPVIFAFMLLVGIGLGYFYPFIQ
jgi:MFS family permease